ncbi:MAG: hypothetical protein K2Q17_08790 [Nitrospiraceae bacterium]|jgi:hypothetical protein|uniref:hypothetical protein n=1 Tax=Nitrospira cf. moscoviensis SBR1015 TaxID=96242 RepID=UPI000A0981B5|nr:hypothetical protein [Nitrospira cf. moscoviensis SBR1015]MBY0247751.1 hypothetical protein [Nitrospiraceae bacterium]OQW35524.1 MAG: hypothetical protein A4E20_00590 [Nitrospira sp. SG-bin2]
MTTIHRFVITNNGELQNFLTIKETKAGDLIHSARGKQHSVLVGSEASTTTRIEENSVRSSSITIHPNLNSDIGSITINYKDNVQGNQERKIAGVLDVKFGQRLFPIITSIGRNIGRPGLTIDRSKYQDENLIELWPGNGIDLTCDSLAYSVLVANPNIRFAFPEDFPRHVVSLFFQHFQVLFLYWLFNQPTKFRGTTLTFSTSSQKYINGFEFHEALNFTNDITLAHSQAYSSLPDFPGANPPLNTDAPTSAEPVS